MQDKTDIISEVERFDRLRLIRSENVGPVTFRQLLTRYQTAGEALAALPELAARGGLKRKIKIANPTDIRKEIDAAQKVDAKWVAMGEADYPSALAVLNDSPPMLCMKGHPVLFQKPAVGIVGARNASANGRSFTQEIARELGDAGLLVVSGLARGIDAAAHAGSLATGTAAVVAGGVDIVFPPENRELQQLIGESGVIVSEMPVGTVPKGRHFPRRNRIISGISYGVVVVEAALRSGSLITARIAGEQGREVFAVPGSPKDPRCKGTNNLLRQGAQMTETAEDVLNVLKPMLSQPLREPDLFNYQPEQINDELELSQARHLISELLGPSPVEVDELIRQSKLTPTTVLTILLELELAGRIERHAGQKVSQRL
jgi:DNA processing protein